MRSEAGDVIAQGDLSQVAHGDRVTSHLTFHFKDGSLNEETVVFFQRRNFRLVSDHLVQKGPSFKHPLDISINALSGEIVIHSADEDGKDQLITKTLQLPPDLANGMIPTLLANIPADIPQTTVSMLVATPKPRVVKLVITPSGEDSFSIADSVRKATRFTIKVDLGGVAGVVAPIVGKQPPDSHVWIVGGDAPSFVKSDGPMFEGGPIWQTELASPVWPKESAALSQRTPD